MFDGKHYHETVVWFQVLQSWYTTRQLWCLMANDIFKLQYDLKCCSLDIQYVTCDVCWLTLSLDYCMTWRVAVLIYNTSAVMFAGKHYRQTVVWLEVLQSWYTTRQLLCVMANVIIRLVYGLKCCGLDIQHVSCYVWWQTLSSDLCMAWSVAVLIYNTSAVMFDDKRYHQTSVWLEVLQYWYTTRQLLCLLANAVIRLVYDLKCCSLDIYTTCQLLWVCVMETLSSD